MALRTQIEDTLHVAMRNKDEITRNTLRMVLSAIKFSEIESKTILDDHGIIGILQKEIKIRKETLKEIESTKRPDLEEKAISELVILERFLPAQLSDEQIIELAQQSKLEVAATNPADMGKVMKVLLPKLAGLATPDRVSVIVKRILSE